MIVVARSSTLSLSQPTKPFPPWPPLDDIQIWGDGCSGWSQPMTSSLGLCTSHISLLARPMSWSGNINVFRNTVRMHTHTFYGWYLELLHALYLAVENWKLVNLLLFPTEHSPHILQFPFPDKVGKRWILE